MSAQLRRIGVHVLVCGFLAPMSKIVKKYNLGRMTVDYPLGDNLFLQNLGMENHDLCSVDIEHEHYQNGNIISLWFKKCGLVDVNEAREHPLFEDLADELSGSQSVQRRDASPSPWLRACVVITQFYESETDRLVSDPALQRKIKLALSRARDGVKFAFMSVGDNINNWPLDNKGM